MAGWVKVKSWARSRIVRALALALALTWFNPFDFQRWTQSATEDFIFRVLAPSYPDKAAPEIWVVIADDQTLASNLVPASWKTWPLPLFAWGNALEEASDAGARQIFVDVAFIDNRSQEETDALVRSVEYASRGSEVYLLVASPETGAIRPVLPELAALSSTRTSVHLVSGLRSSAQAISERYRLDADEAGYRAAAEKMAADSCEASGSSCHLSPPAADRSLVMWWGMPDQDACSTEGTEAAVCRVARSSWTRATQLLLAGVFKGICDVFNPGFCRDFAPEIIAEYPFKTFGLHQVAAGAFYEAQEHKPHAVFVGSAFSVAADTVQTSAYGELPGVFAHAMAYSNLMALGDGYIRDGAPFGIPDKIYETLWIVLIAMLIGLVNVSRARAKASLKPAVAVGGYVGIFMIILVGIIAEFVLRVAPTNWIGIVGTVSVAELLFRGRQR